MIPAISVEQIAKRYEERKADFQTPETVNLQYVQLNLADVAAQVEVTEEGLRAFYDQVAAERYTTTERRRARHILIESGSDDAAAKAKAEKRARAKAKPKSERKAKAATKAGAGRRAKGKAKR